MSVLVSSRSCSSCSTRQQMGFVDDQDDGLAPFLGLGREEIWGLSDQGGPVELRGLAEGGDDGGGGSRGRRPWGWTGRPR